MALASGPGRSKNVRCVHRRVTRYVTPGWTWRGADIERGRQHARCHAGKALVRRPAGLAPPWWEVGRRHRSSRRVGAQLPVHFNLLRSSKLVESINLLDVNPSRGKLAVMARGLDFTHEDAQPDAIMNAMLWKAVKGENAIVPAPTRAAFIKSAPGKVRDDD